MTSIIKSSCIIDGSTSRLLKKRWVTDVPSVTPAAFDLRDRTPPEKYVSFFMIDGISDEDLRASAISVIGERINLYQQDGAITILNVAECLDTVNDDESHIILFREEQLPHCGLYYLSTDNVKILEAKNTLCFIAKKRLYKLQKSKIIAKT